MRLVIAGLALLLAAPAFAKSPKSQCKDRCKTEYKFCLNRSTTKNAKKSCKKDRKLCKGNCK